MEPSYAILDALAATSRELAELEDALVETRTKRDGVRRQQLKLAADLLRAAGMGTATAQDLLGRVPAGEDEPREAAEQEDASPVAIDTPPEAEAHEDVRGVVGVIEDAAKEEAGGAPTSISDEDLILGELLLLPEEEEGSTNNGPQPVASKQAEIDRRGETALSREEDEATEGATGGGPDDGLFIELDDEGEEHIAGGDEGDAHIVSGELAEAQPAGGADAVDISGLLSGDAGELAVSAPSERRENPLKEATQAPAERAVRLARALVSDMISYRPNEHRRALQDGAEAVLDEFSEEIDRARDEFYAQVDDEDVPDRTQIFDDAVNDILGKGLTLLS